MWNCRNVNAWKGAEGRPSDETQDFQEGETTQRVYLPKAWGTACPGRQNSEDTSMLGRSLLNGTRDRDCK